MFNRLDFYFSDMLEVIIGFVIDPSLINMIIEFIKKFF